jgi:hypothetical protein
MLLSIDRQIFWKTLRAIILMAKKFGWIKSNEDQLF